VATCAEVSVDRTTGKVKLVRVVEAFECGAVVNPDQLKNQIEGSIVMAIGGALFEAIDFDNGKIINGRFSRYRVPRFSDVPIVEAVLVDRKDFPSAGAGKRRSWGLRCGRQRDIRRDRDSPAFTSDGSEWFEELILRVRCRVPTKYHSTVRINALCGTLRTSLRAPRSSDPTPMPLDRGSRLRCNPCALFHEHREVFGYVGSVRIKLQSFAIQTLRFVVLHPYGFQKVCEVTVVLAWFGSSPNALHRVLRLHRNSF